MKKLTEKNLKKLYFKDNYSISDIVKKTKISRYKIEKYFIEYNIIKKTMSDTIKSDKVKNKTKETNFKKYGVEHPKKLKDVNDKYKETCLKKYGVENTFQFDTFKKKIKETNLKKYGNEHPKKLKEINDKYKVTCLKKYGVENTFQFEEFKEKIKKTNLKKYGNENVMLINVFKEKIKATKIEKYGISSYNNREKHKETISNKTISEIKKIIDKRIKTNLIKYGVTNSLLLKDSIEKSRSVMLEKYGVEYGFQSIEIQQKIIQNPYKLKKYIFKSGRIDNVLGYENIMLNILENEMNIDENDIYTNYNAPIIDWIDLTGKNRKHIPDIYIKSKNLIYEVKSEFTFNLNQDNIFLKKIYAEKLGYQYKIVIINKKNKKIEYEL